MECCLGKMSQGQVLISQCPHCKPVQVDRREGRDRQNMGNGWENAQSATRRAYGGVGAPGAVCACAGRGASAATRESAPNPLAS